MFTTPGPRLPRSALTIADVASNTDTTSFLLSSVASATVEMNWDFVRGPSDAVILIAGAAAFFMVFLLVGFRVEAFRVVLRRAAFLRVVLAAMV